MMQYILLKRELPRGLRTNVVELNQPGLPQSNAKQRRISLHVIRPKQTSSSENTVLIHSRWVSISGLNGRENSEKWEHKQRKQKFTFEKSLPLPGRTLSSVTRSDPKIFTTFVLFMFYVINNEKEKKILSIKVRGCKNEVVSIKRSAFSLASRLPSSSLRV